MAALLANQVGERAINYIKGRYLVYEINLLDPASAPSDPFSPAPVRDSVVALILGGVAGILLVVVRELLTSPLTFFRNQLAVDQDSGAFTSRHMRQLVEQTANTHEQGVFTLLDVTNLIEIKDLLPKPIWRELLRQVVEIIRQELRGKDSVGHWDATTFAFLMPGISEKTAVTLLTTLHNRLLDPISLSQYSNPVQLVTRIGVATNRDKTSLETLDQAARQALAQAADQTPPIASLKNPRETAAVTARSEAPYSVAPSS